MRSSIFKPKDKIIIPKKKSKKKTFRQKYGPKACCKALCKALCKCFFKLLWLITKSFCRCCAKMCKRLFCGKKKQTKEEAVQNVDVKQKVTLKSKHTQTKPISQTVPRGTEILYKKNSKFSLSAWSGDIELIKGADAKELNKKFNFTGSKAELLDIMVRDYSKEVSLTGMKQKSKVDINKLNKEQVETMLERYETKLRKNRYLSQHKYTRYRDTTEDIKKPYENDTDAKSKHEEDVVSKSQLNKLLDRYRKSRANKQSFSALTKVKL